MNTFRNAPELWAHTRPAAAETQPADLDDPAEVRRTLRDPLPEPPDGTPTGRDRLKLAVLAAIVIAWAIALGHLLKDHL